MIEAWHFVGATLRDGRPIPADGEWLVHAGPVEICSIGLHASRRPWHALQYAPGDVLCRVECDDIVAEQNDKLVCRRRRIIARADVTDTLRYFARIQALSVIHLYDDPPDVVLDYLMTGDESIRGAARDAAMTVTCNASAAAWKAAWDVAWFAAQSAAWYASKRDAATWAATWVAAGRDFDELVYEGFRL